MNDCIGYDCDGREIYEFLILRAIWSNDFDIEELKDADPRHYCALVADNGNAYAMSVFDHWNKELIIERENLKGNDIPVIVKPIDEMVNYEVAICSYNKEFYYQYDKFQLKEQLNNILKEQKEKKLKK